MKCSQCGCEFEGKFCPECGMPAEEITHCPLCGQERKNGEKFCSQCGYSYEQPHKQEKGALQGVYGALKYIPYVLFALMSVLTFLFMLAPAAEFLGIGETAYEFLGDGAYESYGMQSSMIALLIFAIIFIVAAIIVGIMLYRAKAKDFKSFLHVLDVGGKLSIVYYAILLIIAIVACIQTAVYDDGIGLITVGACPVLIIVFSALFAVGALGAMFARKKLAAGDPVYAKAEENAFKTITINKKTLSPKAKKTIKFLIIGVLVIACAIAIICVCVINATNIFTISKVEKIALGDSKSQVVSILGEPDEYTDTTYSYFSDNYKKIYDKINNASTDDIDDWDDLAEALEEEAELYAQLESITYKRIDVTFDNDGNVTAVYFDKNCCDSSSDEKTLESVEVLSGSIAQYSTDSTVEITYTAKFSDGSYVKASATASRGSSDVVLSDIGSSIEITWSDTWCENYSAYVKVVSGEITYHIDGTTLYFFGSSTDELKNIDGKESITTVIIEGSITSIEEGVFSDYTSLTSVTIGNSVTTIGDSTFNRCTKLTSVTIGDSVTTIGDSAFENCISLASITIPDSVTTIGDSAFYWCTSLTSITIPDSVTTIGERAFHYCTSLTSITVNSGNKYYKSVNGNLYSQNGKELIQYAIGKTDTSFTIPNSVTTIGDYAFGYCRSLTSIKIPDSVTTIGDYAFFGCTALTEINFNATAMEDLSSGNNAFYKAGQNGDGITVTIGANVTKIPAYLFNPNTNSSSVPNITSVVFDDNSSCTSIGEYAFAYCTSLTSITIPDSVTTIGSSAFYYCTALKIINFNATSMNDLSEKNYVFNNAGQSSDGITVTIGANVTKIPAYLFYPYSSSYAPNITSVVFEENSKCKSIGSNAFAYCSSLESIIIPDSIITIGDYAFRNCTLLTSITIPDSVTVIGDYAFFVCSSLTEINFNAIAMEDKSSYNYIFAYAGQSSDGITVTIGANVTKVPAYLFAQPYYSEFSDTTHKITSVVFEDNSVCTSIGDYAFVGCTLLTSITIPDSVTAIGEGAFYYCTSLTSVILGSGVTTIGIGATTIASGVFSFCASLKSITIPDSVISIGNYAFYNCSSLTSVTIGSGVTTIGGNAFRDCYKLVEVYNLSSLTITAGSSDNGYVGYYAKNVYTNASATSNLFTQGDYIFYNDSGTYYLMGYTGSDTALTLPTLTIGGDMVSYSIYQYAFYKNTKITSVAIGDNVTSIGAYAFGNCTSLTSVTIGDSVTIIGDRAFYWCTSLTSVTIPNSVTSIGDYAFYYCSSLKSVYYKGTAREWNKISIGSNNTCLTDATIYYYVESGSTTVARNYWYYDNDGNIKTGSFE